MKIKKLIARNFKGYDKLEFEPKHTTYAIVGHNGAGKTTTQQAIRYALTGDLPEEPVKKGCDELEVEVLLESGADFSRSKSNTKPSKIRLNGKTVTGKALTEYLESTTSVPMEGIKLSSSAELVENLKPEEFGEFIMKFTPEELDFEIVKGYMGAIDPAVEELLKEFLPTGEKFGYERLTEVYTQIFDRRKTWKQELVERQARVNAFKGEKPIQTMSEVNKQIEDIIKKEGEIDGLKLANKAYQRAVESRQAQEKAIAELEAQIAANTSTRPITTEITEIKAAKQKLNEDIISITSAIRLMQDNMALFQATLDNINKPFCPLSERLCCTTDKTALKEEFEESVKATKEEIDRQSKILASKKAEMATVNDKEAAFNKNAMSYNSKVTLMSQLEKRKKELITLPEKPKALPDGIEALEEQKHNLYVIRDRILAWVQHEKDEDEAAIYAKKWKLADILVSQLRPNGPVATGIAEYYLDVFQNICNDTLEKINPEYKVKFVADKGVRIEVETKTGRGYVPFECVSSGERACVIFALMDLISRELTQLGIMIIDDLDKLDKEAFDSLIKCIMDPDVQAAYDHIIICAVNHEDTVATLKSYKNIELIEK